MTTRTRLIGLTLLVALLAMVGWQPHWISRVVGPCLFQDLTGRPCFTCGTTRAWTALVHGHPWQALQVNPLAVLALVAVGIWLVRPVRPRRWRWWLAAAVVLTAANWTYLLITQ